MLTVFLGGTCNSTWRDDFIPMLDRNKIQYFNPIVEKWDTQAQKIEDWHKANDDFVLFVLTPEMTGIYSVFEMAESSVKRPDETLVCILEEQNNLIFSKQIDGNIAKIKKDLCQNGVQVFHTLEEVAEFLNHYVVN